MDKFDKKNFVEGTMSETFASALSWIDHLEYAVENYDEIVTIVCRNNHKYHVNVAGDSPGAIISDVIREAMRH